MRSSRSSRVRRALVVGVALLATAASACTTDEGSSSSPGATDGGSATPTTTPGTAATGTPIKLGWVNMERGAAALPDVSAGAKAAVERVNKYENGINGHPIELVTCDTDGTPESSAACANQFVAAQVAAVVGGGDLGTDAMIPILDGAGIATMAGTTLGTSQTLNPNAFIFGPPATSYPQAEVDLAASLEAKKVVFVLPDVSQVPIVQGLAEQQGRLHGIEVSVVKFDPAAPDFAAAIAAVTSENGDAIATIATDDWCTGIARAAITAGFQGKLIMGLCTKYASEVDLSKVNGAYMLSSVWSPSSQASAPAEAQVVIDEFRATMADVGRPSDTGGIIFGGYAAILQTASSLRVVGGDLSAATILAGMRDLTSAPNPLGETISCSPRPFPGTSACTKGWLWLEAIDAKTSKPLQPSFVQVQS